MSPATASATASSKAAPSFFTAPVVIFLSVSGGIVGLCVLAAVLLPLFYAYRRRQASVDAHAVLPNNEKGASDIWLPAHERQTSDGRVPLLTATDSRLSDASVRKPHYRLVSESRPLQPVDYIVDIGRQSVVHNSDDEDEEGRSNKFAVPRIPFPMPLPSPMSQKEIFLFTPEDPPTPAARVPEPPEQPSLAAAATTVATPAQKSSALAVETSNAGVSRSSTLSTASLYSQKSVPSPQQETATTPSVSAFPLPPPMNAHQQRLAREGQMNQRSSTAIVSHLLQDRSRVQSHVPARSPNRPSTRDTDTSTLVDRHENA